MKPPAIIIAVDGCCEPFGTGCGAWAWSVGTGKWGLNDAGGGSCEADPAATPPAAPVLPPSKAGSPAWREGSYVAARGQSA
jgi:hypothetical protein